MRKAFVFFVTLLMALSLISIAGCVKKEADTEQPTDIIAELEDQPTPPIDNLDQVLANISQEKPAAEVEDDAVCNDVGMELKRLNGFMYCVMNQSGINFFRFAVENTGNVSIDELFIVMHGQEGTAATSNMDIELSPQESRKLSAFYDLEAHGKAWKVEFTPKVYKASDRVLVNCTSSTILISADDLPSKSFEYCYS